MSSVHSPTHSQQLLTSMIPSTSLQKQNQFPPYSSSGASSRRHYKFIRSLEDQPSKDNTNGPHQHSHLHTSDEQTIVWEELLDVKNRISAIKSTVRTTLNVLNYNPISYYFPHHPLKSATVSLTYEQSLYVLSTASFYPLQAPTQLQTQNQYAFLTQNGTPYSMLRYNSLDPVRRWKRSV